METDFKTIINTLDLTLLTEEHLLVRVRHFVCPNIFTYVVISFLSCYFVLYRQLRIVSLDKAKVVQYSSVGLDGAMVIWDFKVLSSVKIQKDEVDVVIIFETIFFESL